MKERIGEIGGMKFQVEKRKERKKWDTIDTSKL
jgi:hypothetical protein